MANGDNVTVIMSPNAFPPSWAFVGSQIAPRYPRNRTTDGLEANIEYGFIRQVTPDSIHIEFFDSSHRHLIDVAIDFMSRGYLWHDDDFASYDVYIDRVVRKTSWERLLSEGE